MQAVLLDALGRRLDDGPMSSTDILFCGDVVLPDRILDGGAVLSRAGRIIAVGRRNEVESLAGAAVQRIDAATGYLAPGYVDLHVHGGSGADFMDGTPEAFATVLQAHARHGTTSIVPTTTVARPEQVLAMLDQCRRARNDGSGCGARVLGAHLYGPHFRFEARGCHPGDPLHVPSDEECRGYLDYADALVSATVAPELPGTERFVRACVDRGIGVNIGHSHATLDQVAAAVDWGARHVDHLYCAMSDKSKLRQTQAYPMRGGVLEAALYFDELTTEVIADGKHLSADLLLLAFKIKGLDRLALVTDCNRALDMSDGTYLFGPLDGGEPIIRRDDVGIMPDGSALASSVQGMDHLVRTFVQMTGRPIWEAVRLASLTPARIAGRDWAKQIGSLEVGKRADVLVLDRELHVQRAFISGNELNLTAARSASDGRETV